MNLHFIRYLTILCIAFVPSLLYALEPSDLPRKHFLFSEDTHHRSSLQIQCDSGHEQIGDYLEGEKLRCSLLETIVERDSQDILSVKLTRLFEMINEIKEDQFEMSSYKEICDRRATPPQDTPEPTRESLIDRFCVQKDSNLERAVVHFLMDLTYLDHDTCRVSSEVFELDFHYQQLEDHWKATRRFPICGVYSVFLLAPDSRHKGLWTFSRTTTVDRKADQDPICLSFDAENILFSETASRKIEMGCKVVQFSE